MTNLTTNMIGGNAKMKNIGFTIGKFAPLHKGHQYLLETALKEMDELYVIVYDTNLINISTETRAKWIKTLYPSTKILLAKNPPSKYGLDEESVKIQIDYLKKVLGNINVTHFYSSENYGKFVARDLNVNNRIVDYNRLNVPVSATKIRNNINKYSNYIDKIVLEDIKHIY